MPSPKFRVPSFIPPTTPTTAASLGRFNGLARYEAMASAMVNQVHHKPVFQLHFSPFQRASPTPGFSHTNPRVLLTLPPKCSIS